MVHVKLEIDLEEKPILISKDFSMDFCGHKISNSSIKYEEVHVQCSSLLTFRKFSPISDKYQCI